MHRSITLGLAAVVTAIATTLALADSASAAADRDIAVTTTGARGEAFLHWTSPTRADPVDMRVYDTGCDGKASYAYFVVHAYGSTWSTSKRWNKNGCQTDASFHSYIHDGLHIHDVVLHICRDGGPCNQVGSYNPYWDYH